MCLPGFNFGEFHEIICLNMVVIGLLTSVFIATMWICCCPCATYKICCKSNKTDKELSSEFRRKYNKKLQKERALATPLFQKKMVF